QTKASDRAHRQILYQAPYFLALDLLKSIGPVHVWVEARGVGELGRAAELGGGNKEARAGKRAGVVVEVDAADAVERVRDHVFLRPILVLLSGRCDEPLQAVD